MSKSTRRTRSNKLDEEITQFPPSLTFPVLTLPGEITSEIFIHCLPDIWPREPQSSISPLLLTCICRQWRNIALATPQLWSTFSMLSNASDVQINHDFINRWLSRSGNLLLSLTFGIPDVFDDFGIEELSVALDSMGRCLEMFWKYSSRWHAVEFSSKPSFLQHPSVSISVPDGGFPQLTHLKIGCSTLADVAFGGEKVELFNDAPQLRSVTIELDTYGDVELRLFHLPWSQLTSFTGKSFVKDDCYYVLTQTPALIHCTFMLYGDDHGNSPEMIPPFPPIPNLKSLSITAAHDISEFLGTLTLPGLETLDINNSRTVTYAIPAVRQLLIRSHCALRNLTYRGQTSADEFFDCLRLTPGLTFLDIPYSTAEICGLVFERLHKDSELVPQLQKLMISLHRIQDHFPFDKLLVMLQSRYERPNSLRYLELCESGLLTSHKTSPVLDPSGFKELVQHGMHVYIGNPGLQQDWLHGTHFYNRHLVGG
ncbi:hypothetical protein C8R43DRAFT_1231598 [Mycena crocata]|nr:hypothetical protein C8R43DRAFT_1231598 [Mycena crocata]